MKGKVVCEIIVLGFECKVCGQFYDLHEIKNTECTNCYKSTLEDFEIVTLIK